MRNHRDSDFATMDSGHGQTDALNGDRSLFDDILFQPWWKINAKPIIFTVRQRIETGKRSGAVDVSLHDVPAQTAIGTHGQLEIYQRARLDTRKGSAVPGLQCEIGIKGFARHMDRRETYAADSNAVADLQFLYQFRT